MNTTSIVMAEMAVTRISVEVTDIAVVAGPSTQIQPCALGQTIVLTSAVTGPRGRPGEGVDNFDGDPLLIYRLYSGMNQ